MIRFDSVTKTIKQNTIIDNISFEISKGDLVVLIGSSGCGKTTTLKMINKLTSQTSGNIFIDGKNINSLDPIKLRRQIGYVIQQTGIFPHMTVRENIEIIPVLEKRDKAEITRKTSELMEMVGMDADEYLERYPVQLSGGQQQRVGVARAFATDPEIILMDEPFSALDPITRSDLQEELLSLQSKLKKTIVFVTHDIDEALKIADKLCIMENGKIIQFDTPEGILKNPANDFVTNFVGQNRIWSSPEFITAEDIMMTDPVTCFAKDNILKSLEKMRQSKVNSLMVIEEKTHIFLGICKASAIRRETDLSKKVSEIMNREAIRVTANQSILEILDIFDKMELFTIPVVDDNGVLKGIITNSSLVTILNHQYNGI